MEELDPRKQTILRAVIIEYIEGAEPIGSEALVQKYQWGVRAATVRNELAEMSDLGLLEQPHTSAGRIPSDMGYRYFVDKLLSAQKVSETERQNLKQTTKEGDALTAMLRETARTLSRITHLLSAATVLRNPNVKVRSALVSALGPHQALLLMVLSNGHVENRMIECPVGLTLQDVGAANQELESSIVGKSLKELRKARPTSGTNQATAEKLMATVWNSVRQVGKDLTRGLIITEGEEFIFGQPEFRKDIGQVNEMLKQLLHSDTLYEAMTSDTTRVVTIGKENRQEAFHQLSMVRHSFYVGDSEAGVIAIIGPTRMDYSSGMPLVDFTAKSLTASLTKFFG